MGKASTKYAIEKRPGVYRLQNVKNGKFYIGSSRNLYMRYYTHLRLLKEKRPDNVRIKEDCEDPFVFGVVEYCDEKVMKEREQYYFELWKPVYNVWLSVYDGAGRKYTDKQLEYFKSYPHGPKNLLKHSECLKEAWKKRREKYSPEELSKKMANARRGIKHTEETKKLMSEKRKGGKKPEGFGEKIRQVRLQESKEIKEYRKMKMLQGRFTNGLS